MLTSVAETKCEFDPRLMNNCFGLREYMSGKSQLKAIKSASVNSELLFKHTFQHPKFNRLSTLWICSVFPLKLVLSGTCAFVAHVLNGVWLKNYAAFFQVASKQLMRSWEQIIDQWTATSPLLVPAANYPKMRAWDVYMCKSQSLSSMTDAEIIPFTYRNVWLEESTELAYNAFEDAVRKSRRNKSLTNRIRCWVVSCLFNPKSSSANFHKAFAENPQKAIRMLKEQHKYDQVDSDIHALYTRLLIEQNSTKSMNHVEFYHPQGECRGASNWFIRLFLKSQVHFSDPTKNMIAVAKQFEDGVPGQGLVLQGLLKTGKLLGEKETQMQDQVISSYELDDNHEQCLEKIQKLPVGIYRVGVLRHSLVYLKAQNGECLMWDPDFGLYEKDAQGLFDHVFKNYYEKENPGCQIGFTLHESTEKQ